MNLENKKQMAIMLSAIGAGLLAAVLTGNYIEGRVNKETARLSTEFENNKVKPLMREISILRKEMKELASRPVNVVKDDGSKKGGAPVMPPSSLSLRIPAGKRAYTVLIDSLSAVGGLVNPNDFVDVIAHMQMPDPSGINEKDQKISSIVFQNVQILAVGTNLQAPGGYEQQQSARSLNITLALSAEEAGLLSFIEKNGKMQLILRAPAETETEIIQASTWSALADYVFEKQGTELVIPRTQSVLQPVSTDRKEIKNFIQIYNGGKEL